MNRRLNIFIGVLLAIWGCNRSKDADILSKQTVVIAGKIENVESKVVSIAFQDIIRGQAHFSQIIDSLDGTFKFLFDIYHPQDIRFEYNDKFVRLFIEPSDSLFLTIDSSGPEINDIFWTDVTFSGNNKHVNEDMLKYSVMVETHSFYPNCEGKSAKQYLTDLEHQIKIEQKDLDRFINEYKPSDKFIQWAKKDILYNNANYLINYKAHQYYNNLPKTDSLFNTGLFPVNHEKAIVSSMFGLHLWHYATDRYIQNDSIVMNFLETKNYLDAYTRSIENVLNNEPEGIIRDIMVYKLLSSLFDESLDSFESLWNENSMLIYNPLLTSELDKRVFQVKNANNYSIGYLENFSEKESEFVGDIFTELLIKSKEKPLYVDIWATWCGPCRAEIPHMIEIHEKLIKENIEVISICCNSDRTVWNSLINENKIPGIHYFLDKDQTDLFRSILSFAGYPTYMIIKDGEILNTNAPRPSAKDQLLSAFETIEIL